MHPIVGFKNSGFFRAADDLLLVAAVLATAVCLLWR
jgi:hypothetical protein